MRTGGNCRTVDREISRFPRKERLHMPGSSTTPGRSDLAMVRPKRVAFRTRNGVGTRGLAFAAQWLAYALPYRPFVAVLADANARLGADVDRYSFIVVDLHHPLLAGLPAHFESCLPSHAVGLCRLLAVVTWQPRCHQNNLHFHPSSSCLYASRHRRALLTRSNVGSGLRSINSATWTCRAPAAAPTS